MTNAQRIVEQINQTLPDIKCGSLRFWGEWFGRPYDNQHRIVSCGAEVDLLRINFNMGELLLVSSPRDFEISQDIFYIDDAAQVRWEWLPYGSANGTDNISFLNFVKTPEGVNVTSNTGRFERGIRPGSDERAVEIL